MKHNFKVIQEIIFILISNDQGYIHRRYIRIKLSQPLFLIIYPLEMLLFKNVRISMDKVEKMFFSKCVEFDFIKRCFSKNNLKRLSILLFHSTYNEKKNKIYNSDFLYLPFLDQHIFFRRN